MNYNILVKFGSICRPDGIISCRDMVNELWRWVYVDKTMHRDNAFHEVLGMLLGLRIGGALTKQEYNKLKDYYTAWFNL